MFLNEVQNRVLFRQLVDHVGERLGRSHELAPTVSCDVDRVVNVDAVVETVFDESDVDMRRVKKRLTVGTTSRKHLEISCEWIVRSSPLLGDFPCQREPIGMNARTLKQDDHVAVTDFLTHDETFLRFDDSHRRTGENDCFRNDTPLERRRFAATPSAPCQIAGFLPALD